MDINIIIVIIIFSLSFGFLVYLVLWSRKNIEDIAELNLESFREIVRELRNDKEN